MSEYQDFLQWQETLEESVLNSVETQLPAKIVSYDAATRKAQVQILTNIKNEEDEYLQIPVLLDVPVDIPSGGGFYSHFPLKAGDLGRINIFSKDIDNYKSFGDSINVDNESNFKNFSNAIFVKDFQPFNKTLAGISNDNLVIGREDGKFLLEFTPDNELKITQDSGIEIFIDKDKQITVKQNETQRIKLDSSGILTIDVEKFNVNSKVTNINAASTINMTAPGIVLNGNVSVSTGRTAVIPELDGSLSTFANGILINTDPE